MARPSAKQCGEAERRRQGTGLRDMGLDGHSTLDSPSPGLQWPRDMAAMSFLTGASGVEKTVQCEGEEFVRDPDVRLGGAIERMRCSSAGNGRALHSRVVGMESRRRRLGGI